VAVTSVSSSNADISVVNGTTTPVLTLDNVNGVTKSYYDPTSSIQTQLNGKALTSVFILKSMLNADITTALQSAVNTYSEVVIDGSPGQYVINNTITLPSNVVLRGVNNATITCGSTPAGNLNKLMWYINVNGNNSSVSSLTFKPSPAGFPNLSDYSTSAIYVTGGYNLISQCIFSFSFAYNQDVYGVWCSGATAVNNKIVNNKCYTVGIQYCEAGASYTLCDANYVLNSGADGLSGIENGPTSCIGNIVSNNVVIGAGFSGIEDYGPFDTMILNNIVLNSGQAPGAPAAGQGMGISAVGNHTQVVGNEINGFLNYAVEVINPKLVANNLITESTGTQFGIFCNFYNTASFPAASLIVNNSITGCSTAIRSEGDQNLYLNIDGNTIQDFTNNGIYVETNGLDIAVNICNNNLVLTTPNTLASGSLRQGITSYSTLSSVNGYMRVCNNSVTYLASAAGGLGRELGIEMLHWGTLIENNVVNTNNITTAGSANILTYSDFGNTVDSAKYINNKSFGTHAAIDLNANTNVVFIGNNWAGGDTMVFIDVIKTATNAAYTINAAGTLTKLPVITANRIVTLPSAAANTGRTLKIWNQNTSASFKWSFSGTAVKDAANATITALTNTVWYILESDGTNWLKTN
jgi:hypothetical protein